ncbi:SycD/LcrH family type III secretion system chaperone [Parachlamydia sp. AcF125]|uniref:SycD/LcrH family type III secretion system chaperone n=1 Tax=Parachlamydia sp. AcF125 TaxID=2795736 RepID=UPI001BC932A2|nr:SycD/LcrH family type III secretion system chaperone [Parachlamydia sp. AcF125]MBS4168140.1 Chaperone protein SicA [Parachlamydia sp. AcF125]
MKGEQSQMKKATAQVGAELKEEKIKEVKVAPENGVKRGLAPKDLMGMNDASVEGIYGQAYHLYNTGKYKDASHLFRLLIMLNGTESKYSMGLAASYHMLKAYESAVQVYAICALLDPENPIPHYHSSDCYIQMGDKVSAMIALKMALERAGNKPQYAPLKDRTTLTIKSLQKEIDKIYKQIAETNQPIS